MTRLLLARARAVAPGVPEAETSLLIVGHGTSLNDNSAVAAKEQARRLAAEGDYASVQGVYMEEPPLVSDWVKLTRTKHVVVVPFFIADGLHSFEDIPVLLGMETEPAGLGQPEQRFPAQPCLPARSPALLCQRHWHRSRRGRCHHRAGGGPPGKDR